MQETVVGQYRLVKKLGRNSRHQVYVGQDIESGAGVAVKLVNITRQVDREFAIKRIQLEAKMLKRLEHPNLVRIYEADIFEQRLFFAMELVDGEPLTSLLSRRGKLGWDLAIDIGLQIARALEYVHGHDLLHLKLTPDKILIGANGSAKLTDMRVNRARKRRWDDHRARVLDTAAYLAPEFLTGEDVTDKCDIYSLGVVLYEAITGKLPFEPETLSRLVQRKKHRTPPRISSLVPECPVWIDRLVEGMISGDPAKRPHTMHAVVLSLQEAKAMDATQMGVAQRQARGFNALTAGRDASEARRLLGVDDDESRRASIDYTPFILTGALSLVVLLIAGGLFWVFKPLSEQQLLAKGRALVEQEDNLGLVEAKTLYLEPLLKRFPDGDSVAEAQELMDQADRRLAMQRMRLNERLNRDPKTLGEAMNLLAWRSEQDGDLEAAYWLYEKTLAATDLTERDHGHVLLAEEKLVSLKALLLEDDLAPERITKHFEAARLMTESGNLADAVELLERIVKLYGDAESLQASLQPLVQLWNEIQPQLESQESAEQGVGESGGSGAASGVGTSEDPTGASESR